MYPLRLATAACPPWITAYSVYGYYGIGRNDEMPEPHPVMVPPDEAHLLAEHPRSVVHRTAERRLYGRLVFAEWMVVAVGFIETEALAAYREALDGLARKLQECPVEEWPR